MEPRIQYAHTKDGVSIAYWTMGEGMPLVYMGFWPYEHCQREWQEPPWRPHYEHLLKGRRLIRFDGRGSGLSQRDVADFSLDARLLDLEAVVDHLGVETFALCGTRSSGPVAIAYAARRPERLSHLILRDTYAGVDFYQLPQVRALYSILETDWEMFTETMANVGFGWSAGEPARRFAALLRECVTPEVAKAAFDARRTWDVTDLLPQVRAPTLVLQGRQASFPTLDMARELASRIPNAQLSVLDWDFTTTADILAPAIDEFLGEGEAAVAGAGPAAGGMVTILFTDMEGSTSLTQRLGDAEAQEVLRTHNTIVREALKAHGGSEIKHTGDGIMASFASASKALECAIAMQRAFAEQNESAEEPIRVRVGLNAGEPIAEDEDLFGTAVQLAARICAQAEPGQILAPVVVRELAAGKRFLFSDRGETVLRGFEDPVRLYEVRWGD